MWESFMFEIEFWIYFIRLRSNDFRKGVRGRLQCVFIFVARMMYLMAVNGVSGCLCRWRTNWWLIHG